MDCSWLCLCVLGGLEAGTSVKTKAELMGWFSERLEEKSRKGWELNLEDLVTQKEGLRLRIACSSLLLQSLRVFGQFSLASSQDF